MATSLWGKVYFQDTYAGRLQEEPGGRCIFTYDASYLESTNPAIAHTLPLRAASYISERGIHSFFDNLIAEGWFRNAQAKALGINPHHRFGLLLGFGHDLAGAVSVIDPEPQRHYVLDHADEATMAALLGRASLSGIQRKLLLVKKGEHYQPVGPEELSTHIAKLSSGNLAHLIELEYLTTLAVKKLLPDDEVVDVEIEYLPAVHEHALVIRRFDRTATGQRIHFEEFNQLLGKYSGDDKYDGAYEDMGQFIQNTSGTMVAEAYRLLCRIFVCLLVGNTDAHFKNFAMFHTSSGLRLTPAYDLVSAAIYPEYQSIALHLGGVRHLTLGNLLPKHLVRLGNGFGFDDDVVMMAVANIEKHLMSALDALSNSDVGTKKLRDELSKKLEKRWNGSFKLTGLQLLKKRKKGEKNKG